VDEDAVAEKAKNSKTASALADALKKKKDEAEAAIKDAGKNTDASTNAVKQASE